MSGVEKNKTWYSRFWIEVKPCTAHFCNIIICYNKLSWLYYRFWITYSLSFHGIYCRLFLFFLLITSVMCFDRTLSWCDFFFFFSQTLRELMLACYKSLFCFFKVHAGIAVIQPHPFTTTPPLTLPIPYSLSLFHTLCPGGQCSSGRPGDWELFLIQRWKDFCFDMPHTTDSSLQRPEFRLKVVLH